MGIFGDAAGWVGDRAEDAGGFVGDRAEDAGSFIGDRAEDGAGFVADRAGDVKDFATGKLAPAGLEAFRTAAWAGSEMLSSPINRSSQMLSTVTGKDIPELHLVGKSDTVESVEDALSPVLDAKAYIDNLKGEFIHSTAYAGIQQTTDGVSQLVNKAAGTELIPHVDIINKPEAAEKWSPEWFMQQAGTVTGTVAPVALGGSGLAARLGPRAMALAGVEVTAESSAGIQLASKLAGGAQVSFGYNFLMRPSEEGENFWLSRLQNGSVGAVMAGGQTALRTMGVVNGVGGEAVHTAVDANAREVLKGEGLAEPEDYVTGTMSKAANGATSAVRSGDD